MSQAQRISEGPRGSADLAAPRALPEPAVQLSVVIPVYNEVLVLPLLVKRLRPVLDAMVAAGTASEYEVLFVDDGSTDGSRQSLRHVAEAWPEVVVVELRRNAGQQLAISAGLRLSRGTWVATMDADLQDPPELLPEMMSAAEEKAVDVVYTCHADRASDGVLKAAAAACYYRLVRRVAAVPVEPHVGDYRLMSRSVVDALAALPERHRVHRLLLPWLGFPSVTLQHKREARPAGETHYSVLRLLAVTMDSVVSFTTAPLRWATLLGLATGSLSLLLACGAVLAQVSGMAVPGWASIAVAVTFLGGIQLICTGVLGEYVGRTFLEVQRRPLYDVSQVYEPGRTRSGQGRRRDRSADIVLQRQAR